MRRRMWTESGLAAVTAVLAVVTAVDAEWVEWLFGVDPDGGSGALELGLVVALAVVSLVLAALARRHRLAARRPQPA
ncbi:ABC transporter permease [Phycicoccus duodecadis]|uniref:Uncharacterized protein n=1 Tax=Phycicoccus duodecadis TaxID=173053 RepID=A0A2N3YMJ4_9MICO|nr:ABC transporter permease [Phycicoccus duodecadis]PKW28073.1 hypothetical protein ATL31_2928 [Phycicoccus duodecadis]